MNRRQFLALGTLFVTHGAFSRSLADPLPATPSQAEGPFYPVVPIPERSDLILDPDEIVGQVIELHGRVLSRGSERLTGVRIEIWQCDSQGIYQHPRQHSSQNFDPSFAGFGATRTDDLGRYQFRTLYPVPYGSRPPHIHVKLWQGERHLLTTQLYLEGQTGNEWWGGSERKLLQFALEKRQEKSVGEFDFVV